MRIKDQDGDKKARVRNLLSTHVENDFGYLIFNRHGEEGITTIRYNSQQRENIIIPGTIPRREAIKTIFEVIDCKGSENNNILPIEVEGGK